MASSSSWRGLGGKCRSLLAAARTSASASTATSKAGKSSAVKGQSASARGPVGIAKPVPISPQLERFLGSSQASRTDAVKKVWEYIKLNNLQNPSNKREINCDAKLKTIFSDKDKVSFLEIARLLSQHFVKSG